MAEFFPNQPVTMDTPVVEVTFGDRASALPPGTHTFSLVVVDDLGISSDAVAVQVTVQAKPQANLKAPERVPFGRSFTLDGTPDPASRAKITKWIFTRSVKIAPVIIPEGPVVGPLNRG